MPMKIKSFGCSFIFGSDLSDDGSNLPVATHSNLTWPAHLASKLNYTYECHAKPGSGNLQIAERILSIATDQDPAFFVISWSWIDRFDYSNSRIVDRPIFNRWLNWRTLMPGDNDQLSQAYYKGLHSEFRDKLTSLIVIKLVIDTLNQKQIPFIMTYLDDLMLDQQWNCTAAVTDLQNFVQPCMTQFEGQTFLDWSKKNNFPVSDAWHPLEQAHQAAADYMIKIFDKQKITDPALQVRV